MARIFRSPSRYIQGPGVLSELGENAASLGSSVLAIARPEAIERAGAAIERSFAGSGATVTLVPFNGECSESEVRRLRIIAREHECNAVVGIGGGKALDTAKAVAYTMDVPVAVCPTAASSDAPVSALAVIYHDDGTFERYLHLSASPDIVLMDTAIAAAAPVRLTVAGMGDALATFFEARACARSGALTCAGGSITTAALALAQACHDTLMADGAKAKAALEAGRITPEVENIIEANTLLSGIGFESCGLAAAHAVNNALSRRPEAARSMHGEKVAFGTLVQLVLEGAPDSEVEQVLSFIRAVGLPCTLAELGVEDASPELLDALTADACRPEDTMGNLPIAVTPAMVRDAIVAADELGHARA